ncbi:MAG: PilT/PilU family type 4a pilus ATPase [Armatimonadota bacterium]
MGTTLIAINEQTAEILEDQELFPSDVLRGLLARAHTLQEWLGQVAVDDGLLSSNELAKALSRKLNLQLVSLNTIEPDRAALERLPAGTCKSHLVFPLKFGEHHLRIAMANPMDEEAIATIRSLSGSEISVVVSPMKEIQNAIDRWFPMFSTSSVARTQSRPDIDPGITQLYNEMAQSATLVAESPKAHEELQDLTLDTLLILMMEHRASDLHLAVGSPPMMRVDGELQSMPFPILIPSVVQSMLYAILTDVQITQFEQHWELDFAYSLPGVSRYRVNIHRQRGSVGSVLRTIPEEMPTLEKLKMPPVVRELTLRPRGLVLVTGPTGSGKSTTLAAMVDEINRTRRTHIVTIEDPIEFLHRNNLSVITQREVGSDTESFAIALRHVLRQDPDVILIGEMRDLETIAAAVTAAETGHLVFATLHTTSAAQTIERITDVFPPHQQEQIRSQLSNTLEGILTQTLLPNIDGHGRSCAQEVMLATPAVRNLIREGKVHQMASVIQASAKYGMQTLDQSLKELVLARKVSFEEAIQKASNPEDFKSLVAMG